MKEGNKARKHSDLTQLDRYFRALSDIHRRYILYYLENHRTATVEELAQYIAQRELNCAPSEIPEADSRRLQAKLHHQHLPRLEEYAIIDHDKRTDTVCFRSPSNAFNLFLYICRVIEQEIGSEK